MFNVHVKTKISETDFFDRLMDVVEVDTALYQRAEALISGAAKSEPLFAEGLKTPQDVRYHAEGSFLHDHLRLMLMSLYAVCEGQFRLMEVEEFARLKGYGHRIEALEHILREHVCWFEAFVLTHDIAKWNSVSFASPDGSRGAELGFNLKLTYDPDIDMLARAEMRKRYLELYESFSSQHPNEQAREVQSFFYLTYEIDVKYPSHDRMIHIPVYAELFERFALAHELTDIHGAMLEDIVSRHLCFKRFANESEATVSSLLHLARNRGYDSDNFMDFAMGALFLDFVCGSKRLSAHGYWHEISLLINAFRSEHTFDPDKRAEKLHAKQEDDHRDRLRVFQEVGLDGLSLMELLEMDPGPEFGKTLRRVQEAVVGQGEMPKFGKKIDEEIGKRAVEYYQKVFKKGE